MSDIKWTQASVTSAGNALQAELLDSGGGIVFTRAVAADEEGVERLNLTLQSPRIVEGPKLRVPVLLSNMGLSVPFTMRELRFYVQRTEDGEPVGAEVLYATATDPLGDLIPAHETSPGFTIDWAFIFQFGAASGVTVQLDPAGLISWAQVNAPNGVAGLDEHGKLPSTLLTAQGGSLLTVQFDQSFVGLPYSIVGGDEAYEGTVPESKVAVHSLLGVDTSYTLTVDATEKDYTRTVTTGAWFTALSCSVAPFSATIRVTAAQGSTVTCSKGAVTLRQTAGGSGCVFVVGEAGEWTLEATLEDEHATGKATVTDDGQEVRVTLLYAQVVGVVYNLDDDSTDMQRLTREDDPNHYVTVNVSSEPSPAVGTGGGSSPFDQIAPWSGMYECNLGSNGQETARKGAGGFALSNNTFVYIPAFWCRVVKTGNKIYYYVSDRAISGFVKHPGGDKYIGRYEMGTGGISKTGTAPLVSQTRAQFRSIGKTLGTQFRMQDIAAYSARVLLAAVEFASWDSQSKIGRGYVDGNSAALSTGGTDSMTYHTGRAAGTDGKTAVQWRGVENMWGNLYEFVDGFNANGYEAYVCINPASYADDTNAGYTKLNENLPQSGWIKRLGVPTGDQQWAMVPAENGGSDATHIPDYVNASSGWRVLFVGGYWSHASDAGMLYFLASNSSSYSGSSIGSRLLADKPS